MPKSSELITRSSFRKVSPFSLSVSLSHGGQILTQIGSLAQTDVLGVNEPFTTQTSKCEFFLESVKSL